MVWAYSNSNHLTTWSQWGSPSGLLLTHTYSRYSSRAQHKFPLELTTAWACSEYSSNYSAKVVLTWLVPLTHCCSHLLQIKLQTLAWGWSWDSHALSELQLQVQLNCQINLGVVFPWIFLLSVPARATCSSSLERWAQHSLLPALIVASVHSSYSSGTQKSLSPGTTHSLSLF